MLHLATFKTIFDVQTVNHNLGKLPDSASKSHKALLQHMIEVGPERFCVKPKSMDALDELLPQMPNFKDAIREIKAQCALAASAPDDLELTPILLLGDPGIGKTHFAKKVAKALSTSYTFIPMSQMTAGWILSGASSQWSSSKPGKVFESLVKGEYANPVILVDEVDKAASDGQYDPLGALYTLLERETAKSFIDEFAEVPIDASMIVWMCTANDEHAIPEPLRSRMAIFEIPSPTVEQARTIAQNMYDQLRQEKGWAAQFEPQLHDDVLDQLALLAPRVMQQTLRRAFGAACLANRHSIALCDLEVAQTHKNSIGFV